MNPIDEVVGFFNPLAKLKRVYARKTLDRVLKRSYDGAKSGRRTSGWVTGSTSADSEIIPSISKLRDRSRDLVRNNPYASKAMRVLTSNIVGMGIVPSITDKKTSELWESWALDPAQCDTDGCLDFFGLQRLVSRTLSESGECLVKINHIGKNSDLVVPLQLQVLEPDYLDSNKTEKLKNGYIQYGIEYDSKGKRVAFWLFKQHPGNSASILSNSLESFRVVAEDILHIYEKLRPGQSRGVPIFASCMLATNDLDEYEEATLVRKATEACIAAVVTTDDDDRGLGITTTEADTGRKIEELSPGMVEYLSQGEAITFNNPPASTGYSEYINTRLHAISAGAGVTYEQMTGDLSQVNYSSIRAGKLDFRREVEQLQWLVFIPMLCRPVMKKWATAAELVNKRVKLPSRVEWTTPRSDLVDPSKDIKAETAELETGRRTFSEAARARGYNPQNLVDEIVRDRAMFKAAKIPYPYGDEVNEVK